MIEFNNRMYPLTFRSAVLKEVSAWIDGVESGSIVGLGGAGKSNLLGLITYHPELITQYMTKSSSKLMLVSVDLNNLPTNDLATFYRTLLRSLYEAGEQWARVDFPMVHQVEKLYRQVLRDTDPFVCQTALRELMFICSQRNIRLVLVLDPFDQFCQAATTQILDNLRGLRDSFKKNLSYLVGVRRLITYTRDPAELGELHELLDMHRCWLGALSKEDAIYVLKQVEETLGERTLNELEIEQIVEITGGYPALLKGVTWWLAKQTISPQETKDWVEGLLAETSILNRLQELWEGLTGEEQATLKLLQQLLSEEASRKKVTQRRKKQFDAFTNKNRRILFELERKQICVRTEERWRLFTPLFAKFIETAQGEGLGRITYNMRQNTFFQNDRELDKLTLKDKKLLKHFIEYPYRHCTIDELIGVAWPDDDPGGVSNQTVQHAIYELRKKIEPLLATPCYLVGKYGQGYRFFPEGAPQR